MHDDLGTPTDLNLMLRGVLVAIVFVVLGAVAISNPTPWSAVGQTDRPSQGERQGPPAPVAAAEDSRQA